MKKTYLSKILFVGLLLMTFNQSCTNLDEDLFSQVSADNFFKSPDEFISALGAAYTSLYFFAGHNSYLSGQEVSSDEIVIPQRGGDWFDGGIWLRTATHTYTPNEDFVNNAWNDLFAGVNTANRLIFQFNKLVADGSVPQAQADSFIAELRTLRALFYYYLIDSFANVPIVDDFANVDPPATKSRAEVFSFIESELQESAPSLSRAVDGTTYGRMQFYAAQAILAKLYLNAEVYTGTAQWDKAIAACNEIINSGLYSLESNYFSNFNSDNGNSKERILAIPYDEIFAKGFNLVQMTLHYVSQQTFNTAEQPWNGYCSLQEFYNSYEDKDVRKGVWGNQQIRGNFLAGPQFQSDGVTPITDPGVEDNDPDGPEIIFTPELNELFPNTLRQAGVRVGKYEFSLGSLRDLSNDWSLFRYADILMMKAEALWRKNPADAEALELVNQIRRRASNPNDPLADYTELTAENLLAERGREFFYEGWRRNDQIRFGVFGDPWEFKPATNPDQWIWPIPQSQLDANPNLVQNPGY